MSWFNSHSSSTSSGTTFKATNFFPVTFTHSGYGELTAEDTTWSAKTSGGFHAETQVWYSVLADGSFLFVQVIYSFIGIWPVPASTQMTFKLYNPLTKASTWKSVTTSGFKAKGRGCKSDDFEIIHSGSPSSNESESYRIIAKLDKDVQLNLTFTRPSGSPGFKYGQGEDGGFSYFGSRKKGKEDGVVVHRFHPLMHSSGNLIINNTLIEAKGNAMFVHAIQGMRPNEVASRWDFAFFTTAVESEEAGDASGGKDESDGKFGEVRAVQMEFETTDDYGLQGPSSGKFKTNVGAIYLSSIPAQPLIVTGQTHPSPPNKEESSKIRSISRCTHTSSAPLDKDTGYHPPLGLKYEWEGESRENGEAVRAEVEVPVGYAVDGEGGLIMKVNFIAEIPYVIRKALQAVTGANPFLYQYFNPATLNITIGDQATVPVKGWLLSEATFISP